MAGDFNFSFDSKLGAQGGNPTIMKNCLAKLMELKENYYFCDIWRVRKTKSKRFTFAQKHSSGFIQRRLTICSFNTLEESATMTEILTPISTDHSAVQFSFQKKKAVSEVMEFENLIAP